MQTAPEKRPQIKILHMVAGSETGGAETFCLDAIKALHEAGVTQRVICRPHPAFTRALRERGIPFDTMAFSRFDRLTGRAQKLIRRAIGDFRPDAIHSWMGRASSFVPAETGGAPVLGWFGGYYDLKRYRHCDFYAGVTRDIVRHIGEKSGAPERSFVIHTFGTLEPSPPVSRADFDIPEGAPIVLLLSRMHWKKGVDTLLQAARGLDEVYFLLAGDGPDLEKYRQMAQALGVAERVRFLGWRNDRAALLGIADVCTLPSRYEPFGTVIAEAWFAGVPLVAAKAAGASQYVTHGKDGLLCEIDDAAGLAAQIRAALTDKKLAADLIRSGKETYETLFSREIVTQTLLDTYAKIIAAGKKPS